MAAQGKLAKQKKAAKELADIFYTAAQKFSEREQKVKMREFRRITSTAKPRGKSSKRASLQASSRVSRRVSAAR
jgi:hypothetical protein